MEANSSSPLPTYRIFRDKHGIPQFEPKRGTQALKDALIYAFPTLETELQLMQAALRKFFGSERGSKFVFELPQNDLQTSLAKPKGIEIYPSQLGKASLRSSRLPERMSQRRGSRASSRASSRPPSRPPSRALSRVSSRAPEPPCSRPATPADGNLGGKMTTWVLSSGQELDGRKKQPYDPVKRRKVAENRGNVCDKHRNSKTTCDPELCPDNKAYAKSVEAMNNAIDLSSSFSNLATVVEVKNADKDRAPSTASDIIPDIQTDNGPGSTDLFWDASETPELSFDDSETLWTDISLTNSHSTSWTSHAPNGDLLAGFNSVDQGPNVEGEIGDFMTFDYHEQPTKMSKDNNQGFTPSLLDGSNQLQQQDLLSSGESAQYSEDPFMGWTNKQNSQICEDYGWVLSHVGAL